MSRISQCRYCGGNIVTPAYTGDDAYPVGRMCDCGEVSHPKEPDEDYGAPSWEDESQ